MLHKIYYIKSDGIEKYHQILLNKNHFIKSDGIFQYHQILSSKIFYLVKFDGIEKHSVIYFSSYYNVNGISMARRYWKIPSSSFEVEAIPPPPSASPPEVGSIASTSQDSEGIFQYLLAMLMPLLQCIQILQAKILIKYTFLCSK